LHLGDDLEPPAIHCFGRDAMATTFEIFIGGQDAAYAEQAALEALDEIARIEEELSRFIPSSDIAQINALEVGETWKLGIDAYECLRLAKQMYEATAGVFDAGAGSDASIESLQLDEDAMSCTVVSKGLRIDLGGIGKGYALDRAADMLRDWSIDSALLHCGQSTALALDTPSGEPGWNISIRDPRNHTLRLARLRLCNRALSGSGVFLHGQHIIDPRTREPAQAQEGAWSLASSAAIADALSTALMVMQPDEMDTYFAAHHSHSGLVLPRNSDTFMRWGRWGQWQLSDEEDADAYEETDEEPTDEEGHG
jgi:thiamine biosynthesis lipoprotein